MSLYTYNKLVANGKLSYFSTRTKNRLELDTCAKTCMKATYFTSAHATVGEDYNSWSLDIYQANKAFSGKRI